MAQTPIFDHLESRHQFLTMRKVISGQKYYRNTQHLNSFEFFAKIFKMAKKSLKMAEIPIFDHLESRYQFLIMRKVINGEK